ncbi:MAG: DUF1232 domain-containing protein [Chloroflexi bacterium]|nr:DUF1232 domain-containing protein [Chloroflexota bacterium]
MVVVAAVLAALLLLAVGLWLLWRRATREERRLIKRITRLRFASKLRLARRLATDRRIPLALRAIPPLLVLYLAMPIDIIPDFIPVLGQLDDALIILVGVALLLRFAPRSAIEGHLAGLEAADGAARERPASRGGHAA